jgi:methionyl-tRNA formyltransferase
MLLRLIFMGTPAFVIPVLEALSRAQGVDVVGVYTTPDRPSGRGQTQEMSPVKSHALGLGLKVYQPATLRSARVQAELAALQPDVIVVAAYGRLLPKEALHVPPHGCLNLHPSLLPRYRGPSPVVTAILEGETVTGVTLMLLDEGMDTGPIIAQHEHPISSEDTTATLTATLFQLGADLLLENLNPWVSGRLTAQPQDGAKATITRKLDRADGLALWELSAMELDRRRRAYTPWPGLFTHWQGKVLKLLETHPHPFDPAPSGLNPLPQWERRPTPSPSMGEGQDGGEEIWDAAPGLVIPLSLKDIPIGVVTGRGILGLKALQLEGRRAVTAEEFLRGYPDFLDSRL